MRTKNRLGIYLPAFLITTLLATVIRTVCCIFFLNFHTGYFTSDTLITISGCIVAAAAFFFITHAALSAKGERLLATFDSPATYVSSGAMAIASAYFAIVIISSVLKTDMLEIKLRSSPELILLALSAVSLLVSAANFAANALIISPRSETRAWLGIFTVLAPALYATHLYFTTALPLNAPNKVIDQAAYLTASVFFLYELRISLGRESWRGYRVLGLISAMLTAYSSIPSLITYFSTGIAISATVHENVYALCICIFITARLILSGKIIKDEPSPITEQIKAITEEKLREADSREMLLKAAFTLENSEEEESESANELPQEEKTEPEETFEPIQISFEGDEI